MKYVNELEELFDGGVEYEFAGRLDSVVALSRALMRLYYNAKATGLNPEEVVISGDSEGRLIQVMKDGIDIRPFLKDEEQ